MSAFRKLFIAAAMIGVGLGVAMFLGEPSLTRQAWNLAGQNLPAPATAARSEPKPIGVWASGARLVPEPRESAVAKVEENVLQPPRLESHLAPVTTPAIDSTPSTGGWTAIQNTNSTAASNSTQGTSAYSAATPPRARLRSEAPRPIGNEPRSPATIRRTPAVGYEPGQVANEEDPYKATAIRDSNWSAPSLLPAGYNSETQTTSANTAVYDAPTNNAMNTQFVPLVRPATDERSEPQTHVVVDGDSLEKLAGLYLSDPHRGAEIYELNRELLTSPELLPIGVELKIPERNAQTSWNRQGRLNVNPYGPAVREAASGNLVPVRPISKSETIIPRAQLTRPMPAE